VPRNRRRHAINYRTGFTAAVKGSPANAAPTSSDRSRASSAGLRFIAWEGASGDRLRLRQDPAQTQSRLLKNIA
jgi:hypothetical protein